MNIKSFCYLHIIEHCNKCQSGREIKVAKRIKESGRYLMENILIMGISKLHMTIIYVRSVHQRYDVCNFRTANAIMYIPILTRIDLQRLLA